MKTLIISTILLLTATFASAKDYQVTGSVLEVSDTKIVIDKKGEKFEIAKSASTKATGDLKVGSKATVYYSMAATEIEAKADSAKPAKKKK